MGKALDGNTLLLHGIAFTNGHALIVFTVEIIGDAERCADFILAAVTLADGTRVVIVHHKEFRKLLKNSLRFIIQLFRKRQNSSFEGRQVWMKAQDNACVILFSIDDLLVIGVAEESQRHTVGAQRRLNYIRNIVLVGLLVKIGQILPRMVNMLLEVIVRPVGNPPKLAPAKREEKFNVCSCLGIEGQFFLFVVAQTHILLCHAEVQQPVAAEASPSQCPVHRKIPAPSVQIHGCGR